MSFAFSIPTPSGQRQISLDAGSSVLFVGANGGGKTRLAVHIENLLALKAHRISAHRALALNPGVAKISERQALLGLRTGWADERTAVHNRSQQRWQQKEAVSLLNDFDFLIQALFADQSNKALETHKKARAGHIGTVDPTKFERLVEIWERLLPHRKLSISGDDVGVSIPGKNVKYNGSEMSDGERAIFYMIGQALVAAEDSALIIDEPELHVHRSIMAKLWDELEAARQDCAFIFITHDLEFAASRVAQKFIIRDYEPTPHWTIEMVPENTGFDEETTTLILGSRRPILFVEGDESSLDAAIYRCCYPDWTVIPRGSCEQVIHSVVTMRRNNELTRVTCSGIVDADDYQASDIAYLGQLGVAVLSVSEIENVILLPTVSRAIAVSEGYEGVDLETRLSSLQNAIFDTLKSTAAIDAVVTRYCRRRIDRLLKKFDLSRSSTISDITAEYNRQVAALNIADIARLATDRIEKALLDHDLPALLANYDNKALLQLAAKFLKSSKLDDFEAWLTRILRNNKAPALTVAISSSLPTIQPQ
jgi:ABC-type dipeptide/oligopeptide/nickel transport system ATPase component